MKNADTEAAVLGTVREYVAEWRAHEKDVPHAAWPSRIADARDVVTWAFRLGELHAEYVGGLAPVPPALKDFLLFATHACVRLGEVTTPAVPRGRAG